MKPFVPLSKSSATQYVDLGHTVTVVLKVTDDINLTVAACDRPGPDGMRAQALLASMGQEGRLPCYYASVVRSPDDGIGNCHVHSVALGADLVAGGAKRWRICLGTSPLMGRHSWLEHGDAAIDVTPRDKILISTVELHVKIMQVQFARRFPLDGNGFMTYAKLVSKAK